ncbi:hypothetical protein OY671_011545, partial [Metschnikowia pulcherrima]
AARDAGGGHAQGRQYRGGADRRRGGRGRSDHGGARRSGRGRPARRRGARFRGAVAGRRQGHGIDRAAFVQFVDADRHCEVGPFERGVLARDGRWRDLCRRAHHRRDPRGSARTEPDAERRPDRGRGRGHARARRGARCSGRQDQYRAGEGDRARRPALAQP